MHKAKANKNLEAQGTGVSPYALLIHSPANCLHVLCARPVPMAHSLFLISRERMFRLQDARGGDTAGALRDGEHVGILKGD